MENLVISRDVERRVKRTFDVVLGVSVLAACVPVLAVAGMAVKLTSPGPMIYPTNRFGANSSLFRMYKFRTMRVGTPQLATHLLPDPESHLTPIGSFLRRTSLDELPQLVNVISGEMSFVGPRPALHNQSDLMGLRVDAGVDSLKPGITGLAQLTGRDNLSLGEKVDLEAEYSTSQSIRTDLGLIGRTAFRVFSPEDVTH